MLRLGFPLAASNTPRMFRFARMKTNQFSSAIGARFTVLSQIMDAKFLPSSSHDVDNQGL
jgi:hypothetical protein